MIYIYRNGQYVEKFLDVLFRLLPAELSGQSTQHLIHYFNNPPTLSYKGDDSKNMHF